MSLMLLTRSSPMIGRLALVALFAAAVVSLVSACASNSRLTNRDGAYIDGPEIVYHGMLSDELNRQTFDLYHDAVDKPTTLTITSGGGLVTLGLDLGEWVYRQGLDVKVVDYCLSSCANYVVTAGKRLYLDSNAMLAWHGSPFADEILVEGDVGRARWDVVYESLVELGVPDQHAEAYWRGVRQRNLEFFKTVGVNPFVTTGSLLVKDKAVIDSYRGWKNGGFYYPIDVLEAFGIDNIEVIGGDTWQPKNALGFGFQLVKVDPDEQTIMQAWNTYLDILSTQTAQ